MTNQARKWNPRYVCYAKSFNLSPEEKKKQDDEEFAGACMLGFIMWMGQRYHEWDRTAGKKFRQRGFFGRCDVEYAEFDPWLAKRAEKMAKEALEGHPWDWRTSKPEIPMEAVQ